MPETPDPSGASRLADASGPRRIRRRRKRPLLVRYWWVIPIVAFVLIAPLVWNLMTSPRGPREALAGYITDPAQLEEEYHLFTGKALNDAATSQQFLQANDLMFAGHYGNAILTLEGVSRQAAVPVVFNNLGVLYMQIKDGPHAVRAFRDALARNHEYQPVRSNLKRLKIGDSADPGNSELEPNETTSQANVIWVDKAVDAIVSPSIGDVDCYWFITPRPPRDRMAITVTNRSIGLIPRLRVLDASGKLLGGMKEGKGSGSSVRFDFSPPPNTIFYVQVDGASGTSGEYTLAVNSLKAFDVFEPNDDIMSASKLPIGKVAEGNIMDGQDTDFYSFVSPAATTVSISVESKDPELLLGLGTFSYDLKNIGFAPDAKTPGGDLHHEMKVEANQVYYLQVFGKGESSGNYTLTIK